MLLDMQHHISTILLEEEALVGLLVSDDEILTLTASACPRQGGHLAVNGCTQQ